MKYPEGKMSFEASMPISVQSWFGHELEIRGIDAVIYSRYIISLLQQDKVELDPGEVDADPLWGRKPDLRKLRGRKNEKKKFAGISEEEKKKCAVVECLLGISEEATDIEQLVEELFIRLKNIHAQKENREPKVDLSNQESDGSATNSSSEDPAERYYAAFPALQVQPGISQVSPSFQCDASVWKKNPITTKLAGSSQDTPHDAIHNCGHCVSEEKIKERKGQKNVSIKAVNTKSSDPKVSTSCRKVSNLKTSKTGSNKSSKAKKDKGLNRAARMLSWPPDTPAKVDRIRQNSNQNFIPHKKAKSMSPIHLKTLKIQGYTCRQSETAESFQNSERIAGGSRHIRKSTGVISPVSPEFQEQNCWYTQPLDGILNTSQDSKGRLFNRHSLSMSDQFSTGCASSIESSPQESPNATREDLSVDHQAFVVNPWQSIELNPTDNIGLTELSLPAFFSGMEQDCPVLRSASSMDPDPWSFPGFETLERYLQNEKDALVCNQVNSTQSEESENQEDVKIPSTSNTCLDDIFIQQVPDLKFLDSGDLTKEIHINSFNFFESLEEKPCSQSSPSQYKAWGSLPFEDLTEDALLSDIGTNADLTLPEADGVVPDLEADTFGDTAIIGLGRADWKSFYQSKEAYVVSDFGANISLKASIDDCIVPIQDVCANESYVGNDNLSKSDIELEDSCIVNKHLTNIKESDSENKRLSVKKSGCLVTDTEPQTLMKYMQSFSYPIQDEERDILDLESYNSVPEFIADNYICHLSNAGLPDFIPPISNTEWEGEEDKLFHSEPATPVFVDQPPDFTKDICIEYYNLSQIPDPVPDDVIPSMIDDFNFLLSDSSINLLEDLAKNSPQNYEQANNVDKSSFWAYDSPRKHGVFSAALFTDLVSPLITESIYMFSNPFYGDLCSRDGVLQKIWESHPLLACKASPVSPGSSWLETKGGLPSEKSLYDESSFQKVYEPFNCLPSPSSLWKGMYTTELSHPYITSRSLWHEEDDPVEIIDQGVNEDCLEKDVEISTANEGNTGVCSSLWRHQKSLSMENLSTSLWESGNLEDCTPMSKSFELVPSEHSAFEDVVPKKLSHVLSEPIIKYCQTSPTLSQPEQEQEVEGQKVDTEAKEAKEHLFFSPKTHFRPIQTPEEQSNGTPFDSTSDLHLNDLFGGHSPTSRTPYQSYLADENVRTSFIPRFRVNKASTKCVQTGNGFDSNKTSDADEQCSDQSEADENSNLVFDVLGDLDENPEGFLDTNWATEDNDSERENVFPKTIEKPLEEWNLRSLWGMDSDAEQESISRVSTPCTGYSNNIWSTGTEANIPPLPKLLSFDVDPDSYWKTTDTPSETEHTIDDERSETEEGSDSRSNKNTEEVIQAHDTSQLGSELANLREFVPLPEQAVYSSDLEQKWLRSDSKSETPTSESKSNRRRSRKPCSFFLEGHCRRSDCKFAHDMSSITCRFWEDGDCFKGSTCPFLHGFPSDSDSESSASGSRKASYEWKKDEFPTLSDQEEQAEKPVKAKSLSKAVKKALFARKAWSTYRTYRHSAKQTDKEDKESIPRKN